MQMGFDCVVQVGNRLIQTGFVKAALFTANEVKRINKALRNSFICSDNAYFTHKIL